MPSRRFSTRKPSYDVHPRQKRAHVLARAQLLLSERETDQSDTWRMEDEPQPRKDPWRMDGEPQPNQLWRKESQPQSWRLYTEEEGGSNNKKRWSSPKKTEKLTNVNQRAKLNKRYSINAGNRQKQGGQQYDLGRERQGHIDSADKPGFVLFQEREFKQGHVEGSGVGGSEDDDVFEQGDVDLEKERIMEVEGEQEEERVEADSHHRTAPFAYRSPQRLGRNTDSTVSIDVQAVQAVKSCKDKQQ